MLRFTLVLSMLFYISLGAAYAYSTKPENRLDFKSHATYDNNSSKPVLTLPTDRNNHLTYVTSEFSHNGTLLALLYINQNYSATIKIIDVKTKRVKYSTIVRNSNLDIPDIDFSPNNNMLILSNIIGSPIITWTFTQDKKARESCDSYMGGSPVGIEPDNQSFLMKTVDSEFSLCKPNSRTELVKYKEWNPKYWWGDNLRIPYKNKVLTIYNSQQFQKQDGNFDPLTPEIIAGTRLWDLNYLTDAKKTIKLADVKTKQLYLIDSANNKTTIRLLDYHKIKLIHQLEFNNLEVEHAHILSPYLLLVTGDYLTLLSKKNDKLHYLWHKKMPRGFGSDIAINGVYNRPKLRLNKNKNTITFSSLSTHYIIEISTGTFSVSDLTKIPKGESHIDPQGEYALVTKGFRFCTKSNAPDNKTLLYRLSDYQPVAEITGKVLSVSPDGNTLFVCNGTAAYFVSNSATKALKK